MVAGTFYPGSAGELSKTLAELFSKAKKVPLAGRPIMLIAPHAGYAYSGLTAAYAYKQLSGQEYDTVVIISPSHTVFFQGASVFDGDAYETPFGPVPIDVELSQKIASINPSVYLSNKGHSGGGNRGEHALEVHLPFLQHVLGKFKLVAIVMGEQEESNNRALGEVLASALSDTNSLIVASTDLSHFYPAKEAEHLDKAVREAIESFNPDKVIRTLATGKGEACGGGPVAAAMIAAKRLGGEEIKITHYSNSGDTTGDYTEVVGYLSAVVTTSKAAPKRPDTIGSRPARDPNKLTDDDKKYLLDLAKRTIEAKINNKALPFDEPDSRLLRENRGAFVTIKINGQLRGCIGMIRAAKPLYETVREMAVSAAFEDPRFVELRPDELEKIEVEISALTPLTRVRDLNDIEIGTDGLMIKLEYHSGLLLPQVATEQGWDRTTFLEQTCLKAGLPKNSYKDPHAEIYKFSADVF